MPRTVLSIVELGGYPNFTPLYRAVGYEVLTATSMRKALGLVKRHRPDLVVAEFNYQSDFRDRTSNLESLLATLQARCPATQVIVFYEKEQAGHLDRLLGRFSVFATLPFPVDESGLRETLMRAGRSLGEAEERGGR